jgi:hypothetical protein
MKIGDLVKIKKSVDWRGNVMASTAIIVAIDNGPKNSGGPTRITIHSGERFFLRELEVMVSADR